MTHHRHRALAVGLLVLYFAAAVHMAFALPALATPNELLNFEYVQVMRQIGGLPNRGLVDSEVRYTEWHQPPLYFAFAALFGLAVPVPPSADNPPPPIALPANPHYLSTPAGNRNPVIHVDPANTPLLYTSRVAAALLGALGAAALYAAGKRVYGPAAGLLMASLLAFQPAYIHLSGSVNNDMPLTSMAAVVMSYAIVLVEKTSRKDRQARKERQVEFFSLRSSRPWRSLREVLPCFILGLLCAGAILTKANGVFVLVFPAMVLLGVLVGGRRRTTNDGRPPTADRQPRPTAPLTTDHLPTAPQPTAHWLPAAAATAAGLLPLWAGWLWLNAVRMRDALGLSGSLPVGRVLRLSPLDFGHVIPFLPAIWRSYWLDWSAGDVGYGPDWLYALWLVAVVVMLLGWMKRRGAGEQGSGGERGSPLLPCSPAPLPNTRLITLMVLLAFLGISYLYFAVKALTVKEAGWMVPEGRWWLPGLPMLAWLLAAGYARWWSPRRREPALLAAAAVPPMVALGLLALHLPSLYPTAQQISAGGPRQADSLRYGPLELLEATAETAVIGRPAAVVLTWRAEAGIDADYTVNVQLLAQAPGGWRKLAEHNSFPGQGMNPTRGWRAGEVWRVRLMLRVDERLNGPTLAVVQVRVVEGGPAPVVTGSPQPPAPVVPLRELPPARDGQPVDPPLVAEVVVRPASPLPLPGPAANAAAAPPLATFAGAFDLLTWVGEYTPDDVSLTLWWRATAAPETDYTIFVHLYDAAGNLVAQADGVPNDGLSPTRIWQPGDVVRDVHRFPSGTVVPESGTFLVGAYRPDTGERAPVTLDGAPLPDNAVELGIGN